ncbi:MAG: hypothetical protein J0H55_08480 [Chitinophagaceae bacterium]|nr:hypothetical protein [Chitinophagaceae bacterium]
MAGNEMDRILFILHEIKDNKRILKRILDFMEAGIVPGTEQQEEEIKIPERYESVAREISQMLQMGSPRLTCYLNPDTLETEEIPESYEETDWMNITGEKIQIKHESWKRCIIFEPLSSYESFRIMENFINQIPDGNERTELENLIRRPRPFARFNAFIHNSEYKQNWFDFREVAYEKYVCRLINAGLSAFEEES